MSTATEFTKAGSASQALKREPSLSSAGLPFVRPVPSGDEVPTSSFPNYDGLAFEPFARAFQHMDHALSRSESDEVGDSWDPSETDPFGCQFAQSAYSHHDDSEAISTSEYIRYDEDSQTVVFPPGVVAGKGYCRIFTYWRWRYDGYGRD